MLPLKRLSGGRHRLNVVGTKYGQSKRMITKVKSGLSLTGVLCSADVWL